MGRRRGCGSTVRSTRSEPTGIVFCIEPVTITIGWKPSTISAT